MTLVWKMLHPKAHPDMLGFLPSFLSEQDPRPAREQFNERYCSGWHPFNGFKLNLSKLTLEYPGDPPLQAIAETYLRKERIILFDCAWVVIIQEDGTFEVDRMD